MNLGMEFLPFFKTMPRTKSAGKFLASDQSTVQVSHCMTIFVPENIPKRSVWVAEEGGEPAERESRYANIPTTAVILIAVGHSERGKFDSHLPDTFRQKAQLLEFSADLGDALSKTLWSNNSQFLAFWISGCNITIRLQNQLSSSCRGILHPASVSAPQSPHQTNLRWTITPRSRFLY